MIARIAIDARAMADIADQIPRHAKRRHDELTKFLRDHGVIVFTSKGDLDALVAALKASPFARLWLTTLKELRDSGRFQTRFTPGWNLAEQASLRLPEYMQERIDLLVIPELLANHKDFDSLGYCTLETGTPIAVLTDSLPQTPIASRISSLRERGHFPYGASREDVWHRVLEPLAVYSREVTVLDRYLLARIHDRRELGHVQWLLEKLTDTVPKGARIRVLAEHKSAGYRNSDPRTPYRDFFNHLSLPPQVEVQVAVCPWGGKNGKGPHDRHIRFSSGSAISANAGFDRLRYQTIREKDGFQWTFHRTPETLDEFRQREDFVLDHTERLEI